MSVTDDEWKVICAVIDALPALEKLNGDIFHAYKIADEVRKSLKAAK